MRPHPLPETELWQVVAFLRSINSPDSTSGAVGHGAGRSLGVNVPYDELAATREPAEDWLTYSDRKSTRLNSSHSQISYAVFCLKKKKYADRTKHELVHSHVSGVHSQTSDL